MDQFDMSGRALARRLGRSEGYVRDRLKGEYEWALADVEGFALIVGMNPEDFIASIDREALRPLLIDRGTQEIEAKTLGEVLGGAAPHRTNVSGSRNGDLTQDDHALAASDDEGWERRLDRDNEST
jgi:hypothetical protein